MQVPLGDADTQAYPVVTEAAATKPAAQPSESQCCFSPHLTLNFPDLRLMITDEAELQANPSFKRFHLITLTERTIQVLSANTSSIRYLYILAGAFTKRGDKVWQTSPTSWSPERH